MCEKVFLGLLLVRFERSLEDRLEARVGGRCGRGWGRRGGHDEQQRESIVGTG